MVQSIKTGSIGKKVVKTFEFITKHIHNVLLEL